MEAVARILAETGKRNGRTIYLISDEAYRKILFDDRRYYSPVKFYPDSFLVYTFGKTLLTPGQRIGYIALPPGMKDREALRSAIPALQMACGWMFPNALLMHSMNELDRLSIDVDRLQIARDHLVGALRRAGYKANMPEGTFYVLVKSPWVDDCAFIELLAEHKVFCLPGTIMELPGYFRISLTASDDMIHRAIPAFAEAFRIASDTTNNRWATT